MYSVYYDGMYSYVDRVNVDREYLPEQYGEVHDNFGPAKQELLQYIRDNITGWQIALRNARSVTKTEVD
ncbi:hypothetical protein [Neptunomonas sp.]|uniref:hypothetical protein n=1 Tax=Neptunomonas sp. TaxID=1971898 RepID=UPI003565205C